MSTTYNILKWFYKICSCCKLDLNAVTPRLQLSQYTLSAHVVGHQFPSTQHKSHLSLITLYYFDISTCEFALYVLELINVIGHKFSYRFSYFNENSHFPTVFECTMNAPPLMSCPWCWKPEAPVCLLLFSLVHSDVPSRALSDHVKILLLFCKSGTRARPNVKFAGRLAGGGGRRVNVTENVTLPPCRRSCVSDSWRRLSSVFLACGGRLAHYSNTTETEHCVARCKCFQVTWEKKYLPFCCQTSSLRQKNKMCHSACKTNF